MISKQPLLLLAFLLAIQPVFGNNMEFSEDLLEIKACEPMLGMMEVSENRPSNLTSLESEPSANILNCVSVISGDYTEAATDYRVPGPDPLPIQRVYSSGEKGAGSISYGLHWGKYGILFTYKTETRKTKENLALIIGGGGSRMTYSEVNDWDYRLHSKSHQKGLTNTASGVISGRTNPLNDKLSSDKKRGLFTLTSGGGVVSLFQKCHGYSFCLLQKEKKPNRLEVLYDYDSHNRLSGIRSQNKHGALLASFTREINGSNITIQTSNGCTVAYGFEKLRDQQGKNYFLKTVSRPGQPNENYDYKSADSKAPQRLVKKNRPQGRSMGIEYFEKGDNETPFGHIKINDRDNLLIGRVKALKAPTGHDASLQYIYKFKYNLHTKWTDVGNKQTGSKYVEEITHGDTCVFDVYNHLTRYYYNEDFRLAAVEKYRGQGPQHSLYSREKLYWGGHRLNNRIFETKEGWAQFARQYDYDEKGNIWRQTLWGNLSGFNTYPITYLPNGYPEYNGCEFEFTLFTYSDDGLNLMTSQTEGKTAHTTYTYHPGTDLLASKLTGPLGAVCLREFYEYDINGTLVEHTQDDGSSPDKYDFTGVTQRRLTRIYPSETFPIGLPLIKEEWSVDPHSGTETLIQCTKQTFTKEGYLTQKESYDENNRLAQTEYWEYDCHGNNTLYQDPAGRVTTKRYDENFNLVYEQSPCTDFHTEYHYDFSNRLIKKELVCSNGLRLSEEFIYDLRSNLVAERDIYGNQTSHSYDEFGRRIKTILPQVCDENGCVYAPQIETAYSELSYPTEVTDGRGFTTEKKYTIKGAPYKVFYPDGSVDLMTYNVDGTLKKQKHKNGSYTTFEYDYQKRMTKKEIYSSADELLDGTYNVYSAFNLLRETTLGGIETCYQHDARGRLIETTRGSSRMTYEYDSIGRLILTKTYYGAGKNDFIAKAQVYDVLNRVTEEREEDSSGTVLKKTQYGYDIAGNCNRVAEYTAAGISVTLKVYDPYGQLLEVTTPEGYKTVTQYNYNKCNAQGQIVPCEETTDAMGGITITIKDALGRVSDITKKNVVGHEIQKTNFYYDANGNKTRQVDTVFHPDTTTKEILTAWQYDSCNRLVGLTEAVGAPEQRHTQYVYNNFGQKESLIKPDGNQIFYTYDPLGRLCTLQSSDGSVAYHYTYDLRGNVIKVDNPFTEMATLRQYDIDDNIISETLGNGLTTGYAYDAIGRPTSTLLPDQSSVQYVYDANRLRCVRRCNVDGELVFAHTYVNYDLGGLLLEEKYAGKVGSANYTYDSIRRPKTYSSSHWSETVHTYNKIGDLTSRTIEDAVGSTLCLYGYDELRQVKKESGISDDEYAWDSMYNRLTRNNRSHTYNALNQLINDGEAVFQYDYNGNLVLKTSAKAVDCYVYDALDRLIKVTKNTEQYLYAYDEQNRRLSKQKYILDHGVWLLVYTERFLYHGQNEVGIIDGNGLLSQYRTVGTGKGAEIGATVLMELYGSFFVPIHDHNGNIVSLVDAVSGSLSEAYRHTSFGEEIIYNSAGESLQVSVNPWRFSSKRVDEETGFIYFGRRYYSPELGRWITADPIGFDGGFNLYAYVLNNPLTHYDLYGLYEVGEYTTNGYSSFFEWGAATIFNAGADLIKTGLQLPGCTVELLGLHLLPIPGIQDAVRAVGTLLQGRCLCNFESWKDMGSRTGDLGLPEKDPQNRAMLINGINTSFKEFLERVGRFSASTGGNNVHYSYNGTHGFFADLIECGMQKMGISTNAVRKTTAKCNSLAKQVGPEGSFTIYAHSQGGLISNSLKSTLNGDVLAQINVNTFGSPVQISTEGFKSATNYVSSRDAVPWLSPVGMMRAYAKRTPNTIILPSNGLGLEHSWDCNTYQGAVQVALQEQYPLT